MVKTEADKRYRSLQAGATGVPPGGKTAQRSNSYGNQYASGNQHQSPMHRGADVGPFAGGRPNTANIRQSSQGSFPPAASMHVQPDTATVRPPAASPPSPFLVPTAVHAM